ncbi:signal peptidase I [Fodinicola acaciae]|uniref:signal peptidase I n=1 Tax=Fodinicola acaciae TaxID=2681555 RepID=UPI0013D2ECBB|nr:signal peptidase I [Fodinicola acaciae]
MRRTWVAVAAVGVLAGAAGAALWARRQLVLVTVEGTSMTPTLRHGDRVLVRRRGPERVRHGDIVVLEPPVTLTSPDDKTRWNVKRVVAMPGDPVTPGDVPAGGPDVVPPGKLVVRGDGQVSSDSRTWGFYAADALLGVVIRQVGQR